MTIVMALSVIRSTDVLVKPAEETPSVTLDLSAIDQIPVLRCNARSLHVFMHGPGAFKVIREALSKALVAYYPLAGCLKESVPDGLQVECCALGVRVIEATTDRVLTEADYFQDVESVPYDELLPQEYEASDGREPLVQMQVTQFACGGFVMGLIFCHSISDGLGAAQFLNAVGEFARGSETLTIDPVWHRNFFTCHKGAPTDPTMFPLPPPMPNYQLHHANIDIPLDQVAKLKLGFYELTGQNCSTFEAVAASFWGSRTRAVRFDLGTEVRLVFFANCREVVDPPLPRGFYGNCFFPVTIESASDWIEKASFVDVVKLIQEAKARLPVEFAKYMKGECLADPFAPPLAYTTLFMSEWGRLGFNQVDYGWGTPVHIVPIQGSSIIPVGIVGMLPQPQKGIRLMTWCVEKNHRQGLLDQMDNTVCRGEPHPEIIALSDVHDINRLRMA